MKFSIVIPTFNRAELVRKCISNNLSNIGVSRDEIEVIWIDDGSTDNVRDIMKSFNPDISVLKKKNEGVLRAYNLGCVLATGDWIVIMDSDWILPDNWLKIIKKYIKEIPQSAGIGILIDGFTAPESKLIDKEKIINEMPIIEAKSLIGFHTFSKKLFREVGYFDEEFGYDGPGDWDWSDRAKRTGLVN